MAKVLHLDASGRHQDSVTRSLSEKTVAALAANGAEVTYRDIGGGLPFVDDDIIGALFTRAENRSEQQAALLALSDEMVNELLDNDVYVIGVPVYNFSMPAAFKAWADLVARVGVTFKYTDTGPVGLLENKKAYLVIASGGTPVGSDFDYLTPWLKFYLAFIGVTDIEFIKADAVSSQADAVIAQAEQDISALPAL